MHRKQLLAGRFCIKLLFSALLCLGVILSVYLNRAHHVNRYISMGNENPKSDFFKTGWEIGKGRGKTETEMRSRNASKPGNDNTLIEDIQERLPNLPITFWNRKRNKNLKFNATCAKFPDIFDIQYNNYYWQTLELNNGSIQLYGAYLDDRKLNLLGPSIRLLTMINRVDAKFETFCQIWYNNKTKPIISSVVEYKYMWIRGWGNNVHGIYQPYLLTCKIPKEFWKAEAPSAVSIVNKPCDRALNLLTVFYNKPEGEKKDFAVCVKGLNFPYVDLSVKLIEWIELIHILGADKIFFYDLAVHPNVSKLLNYYEDRGIVHVTPLKVGGNLPVEPYMQYYFLKSKLSHKRQHELIPYNDCFLKHMYEYKYILLLDTDEVIMPVNGNTWKDLMDEVVKKAKIETKGKQMVKSYYSVRNVYFLDDLLHSHGWFDDIPQYMHMLQHVYRAHNFTKPGHYVKSFFNTEKALHLHNHSPLGCLGPCYAYSIPTSDAQLQHYRKDCVTELKKVCDDFKKDTVMDIKIWRYKDELIERVNSALSYLGYLNDGTLKNR